MVIAVLLVLAVIYLFLGNVRATLIPAVTIPVSIIVVVPRDGVARLLDQRADAARPGARHRPGGGRRHRGAGEHLPPHGGRRAAADRRRGRQPRDRLRGDRHHAGAGRGVRADLVPAGQRRPAVPRVRHHRGRGGAVLVAGGADADADDGVEAARRRRHALAAVELGRRVLPPPVVKLRPAAAPTDAPPVAGGGRDARCHGHGRAAVPRDPERAHAARGPRHDVLRHDRSRGRVARVHGPPLAPRRGHLHARSGGRRRGARQRARAGWLRRRQRAQPGAWLRGAGAVERARAHRRADRAGRARPDEPDHRRARRP